MRSLAHHRSTVREYLSIERGSPHKHELCDGQILVMAGGSPRHNLIAANAVGALREALRDGPCLALSSDQRIATGDGLYTYADASVFCGPLEHAVEDTAANPTVLVEVSSPSTREYDRGEKLERYKAIPALRHVVLIEQDRTDVEVWSRGERGWSRVVHTREADQVVLEGLGVALGVAELYVGTDRI